MKRLMITGSVLLAMLGSTPASAQNGFHFTSPVDVAIGREFGIFTGDRKLTDTVLVVRPAQLSFIRKTPRADFTVAYQPELELFDNNRELNTVNQTGTLSFRYKITERLNFTVTDEALATHDPTRTIAGSLILLPRRTFKQNMAHAAVNFAMTSRNTVSFSFDNVAASSPLSSSAFPSSGRVRSAGTVAVARTFQRKQILTGTYSLLNIEAQFFGVAYEGELARDFVLHLSTGLLKDAGSNYLMSAHVEKRLGAIWVNGGYHRFLSVFGTSIPGGVNIGNDLVLPATVNRTNTYQVFTTGVSGKLNRRAGIELRAAVTRNNSGTADRDINNATGRFKLTYSLMERLNVYTDLQFYSQTFNVFVGTPIDRQRVVAGIQVDISSKPAQVSDFPEQTKPTQR
jgi:hypothetical protein